MSSNKLFTLSRCNDVPVRYWVENEVRAFVGVAQPNIRAGRHAGTDLRRALLTLVSIAFGFSWWVSFVSASGFVPTFPVIVVM